MTWAELRSGQWQKTSVLVAVSLAAGARPLFEDAGRREALGSAMTAMRRKLLWVESENFQGWACSECAWTFTPTGPLVGESIDEMKMQYERQRDTDFAAHVCAEQPRGRKDPR